MKKMLVVLLLLALMLSGCVRNGPSAQQPQPSEDAAPSQQDPTETPEQTPVPEKPEEPSQEPTEDAAEPSTEAPTEVTEPEGELQRISWAGFMIFSEPSYDGTPVQPLPVGSYTIVDAAQDDEGLHWGKLKSGLGWICLSHIREFNQPVSIGQADAGIEDKCEFSYSASTDLYGIPLVIHACEDVTDIAIYTCYLGDAQMELDTLIYEQQGLEEDEMMVIRLSFPGDFTTYEVQLTDAAGVLRRYQVSVSGRNGAIAVMAVATE